MHCPSCGCDNREGAKFCDECAAPLSLRCSACGTENRPGAKFCTECAVPLTGAEKAREAAGEKGKDSPESSGKSPASRQEVAERRQLTVLFCDLVGSTAASTQLDPEELREVVRSYQETSTEVIVLYDGHIAQHLGDGLLVYFGYPAAHEDDAQRAIRAGLGIVAALHELNPRLRHPLQVRIGIHTGLVVVGEIGSSEKREVLALGETPNLAARLQALAEPDTFLISAATQRLVEGLFACQDRQHGPEVCPRLPWPAVGRRAQDSEH
jgi:class 3 adenylate cyclase